MVARDAPAVRILSDAEREESLRPDSGSKPRGDIWLLGYGSLIWNPTVRFVERRVARVSGWHRAFCLATPAGRGSVDNPGLVLGLEEGGDCDGVAFRISGEVVEAELAMLWKREMLSAAYLPRWLDLLDGGGNSSVAGSLLRSIPHANITMEASIASSSSGVWQRRRALSAAPRIISSGPARACARTASTTPSSRLRIDVLVAQAALEG